jgi:hypothetical protein
LLRHLNAQPIHVPHELLRRLHPCAQARRTDQPRRFHQGAHAIAQQHPVRREMNVGFEAGAIQKIRLQIQGLSETQRARLLHRPMEQSIDHLAHLWGRQPMGKTLHLALGGHLHQVQRVDPAEPLVEGVAGQLAAEAPIVLLHEGPQDRAPQGPPRTLLKSSLLQRRRLGFREPLPAGQGALDKVPLHAAIAQKSVDLFQALAQGQIVNVPDNGRQPWAKLLGERNDDRRH